MLNVQIVLFDGFDYMDVIGPYEVFTAANMFTDNIKIEWVSAEGQRMVQGGMNGPALPSSGKIDVDRGGILVIPGAMGTVDLHDVGPESSAGLLRKALETDLIHYLRQAMSREDLIILTVCGGSLLFAMDGLLEDRYAVTHNLGMDVLGATGAKPVKARVVDDGRFVSGGGVTSGIDAALYIVERELGPRISHAVEQLFEYERRGTVWRNSGLAPIEKPKETPVDGLGNEPDPIIHHSGEQATSYDGKWDITISTPVGKFNMVMIISTTDGVIKGTFYQGDETSDLADPSLQNGQLTWSLNIKKPMRLNLKFAVMANGDTLTGTAKAGLLPASNVVGTRIS